MNAQPLIGEPEMNPPPLAGEPMSGVDVIVQVFADEGVKVIFGLFRRRNLPVYDAMFRYNTLHPREGGGESMPLIVPTNEQASRYAARSINDNTLRGAAIEKPLPLRPP
jgi:acetolactate synthase-1/2/3 large subunit